VQQHRQVVHFLVPLGEVWSTVHNTEC